MLVVYLLITAMVFALLGLFIGSRLGKDSYHGYMIVEETEQGLRYRLELAGDPELLAFQDVVSFKVIAPDYEALIESRDKLGV